MARRTLTLSLLALLLLGAAFFGGYHLGEGKGRQDGYQWGVQKGRVDAARNGPPQTRDRGHALDELSAAAAWSSLGDLSPEEATQVAAVANQAPSPCSREARRGTSLATTLLDADATCPGLADQLRLARVALGSLGSVDEAVAVLRVERRLQPAVEGRASRGPAEAPVVLTVWSDFQCPYCVRAQGLVEDLLEARSDVRVVYKHLPLSRHEAAVPAALAAEAAAEQGRFWEMHDALFAMGRSITDGLLGEELSPDSGPVPFEAQASEAGLDIERYRADFRSPAVQERVRSDTAEARAIGVGGTPTFFVDGRKVSERMSRRTLDLLVSKALAEQQGTFSWDLRAPPSVSSPEPTPSPEREAAP